MRRLTYLCGFTGVGIILVTCLIAASTFRSPTGLPYSFLNRDISALGEPDFSELAYVFNWGLRIGGLFLVGFMVALRRYVDHPSFSIALAPGILAAVGVVLVGIFPAPERAYHRGAASIVFFSSLITFTLLIAAFIWGAQDKLDRRLVIPTGVVLLAIGSFLIVPHYLYENPYVAFFVGPPGPDRPIVWLPSLLEWVAFSLVAVWVVVVSGYLYLQERRERVAQQARAPRARLARQERQA
ncbi:MAG TPA: DUF998 domain-containing protein [Caldilineaceae bacterium]|nr:DUF998 domain-containing protein [Caldilineaceae bacterium]